MLNALCSKSGLFIQRETDQPIEKVKCLCGASLLPAVWNGRHWAPAPVAPKKTRRSARAASKPEAGA